MGRFGESQDKLDSSQKGELIKTRVGKNLVTKKIPMVTRSIRLPERDIKILEDFFQKDERTFTQGVRLVLKEFMEKENLL